MGCGFLQSDTILGGGYSLFWDHLYAIRLRLGGEDKLFWVPSKPGVFDARLLIVLSSYDSDHW